VATSLAGPGVGFVAGGLVWWLAGVLEFDEYSPYLVRLAFRDFMWVSLGWGLFNLLPILPLDGGSALEAILERHLGADRARYSARVCSCVVGGLVAVLALGSGMVWAGILCGLFTYNNLMALRGLRGVRLVG
jgi:Zn-dependent protease